MTAETSRKRGRTTLRDVERAVDAVRVAWNALQAAAATRDPDTIAEAAADLTDGADNLAEVADVVAEEAELLGGAGLREGL